MFPFQKFLSILLAAAMELGLSACGSAQAIPQAPENSEPPAQVKETPEVPDALPAEELAYIPDSYDGSEAYALYLTLPGYEGLYFQGVGQNLYSEEFAFEALSYNDRMIVAAPQLSDWGEPSAEQTIALT